MTTDSEQRGHADVRLRLSRLVRSGPRALTIFGLALSSFGLLACQDDVDVDTEEPNPSGLFWDHEWVFRETNVERNDGSVIPFPSDFELLERIRYGEGGAPPVGDALEGSEVVFEIDGRVLVRPVGADDFSYLGTNYRVLDDSLLRASVRKTVWFKYEYDYDAGTGTLLISPEEEAGEAVMNFFLDIISATLYSGSLDSAAARVTEALLHDPRVIQALDQFVYDLVLGQIEQIPVQSPEDVTAWLILLLRQTELVPPQTPDSVLEAIITPIVEEILPLDREGIARTLVDRLAESDAIAGLSGERVEAVLTFALYRRALERGQELSGIERVTMVLDRID